MTCRKSREFLDYETNTECDEEINRQRVVTPEEFEKLVTEENFRNYQR